MSYMPSFEQRRSFMFVATAGKNRSQLLGAEVTGINSGVGKEYRECLC